jgi:hypothetical protein
MVGEPPPPPAVVGHQGVQHELCMKAPNKEQTRNMDKVCYRADVKWT